MVTGETVQEEPREDVVALVVATILMMDEGEREPQAVKIREIWPKPSPWRWRFTTP
ncbi:MAG: hypothetical protein OWU33_03310 [Firmicutes bacterium]|jgi:hypothetical protein|nr:hypothetical protein [Bacillota bacterium]